MSFWVVLVFLGQWVIGDWLHLPGGGLGILIGGIGIWWLFKPDGPTFESPDSFQGWLKRCKEVLSQFDDLEEQPLLGQKRSREVALEKIINRSGPQSIGLVGSIGSEFPEKHDVENAISGPHPLELDWACPLPLEDNSWSLPESLSDKDLLLYALPLPLRAVDLLWLEKVPPEQHSWVLVHWDDSETWTDQLKGLHAQLPSRWAKRVIHWQKSQPENLREVLSPLRRVLDSPKRNIDLTRQRLLSKLHSSWQQELELLRRNKLRAIQQRTQWLVAGAVFASPVPSTDLLAVAVVNGLMLQEMAKIWSCPWKPEVLEVVAKQLATAAVAQGVVEWSGQALLGFAKLHGGSWLAAGTLQALSAAYLTRVVGRSMADWMALNNGISEPDLEALKSQASKLVEKAAEDERVDWTAFLKQAASWLIDQEKGFAASQPGAVGS
ncbi:YcjF family protein [Prochlorococcus sp. MIT 1300]|uniref:YcjF family protein n=1 Tax=Prochlorococcus sp. MIT 1300 TaxID=3096218 RepID=UPI002A75D090|nr:YcjF family protein [Prochlorococcus sp. MIT 1300]